MSESYQYRPEIESNPECEPSLREIIEKAIEAGYIVEGDLEYLGEDMQDVIGNLYGMILEVGDDPDEVFAGWGIVAPTEETE